MISLQYRSYAKRQFLAFFLFLRVTDVSAPLLFEAYPWLISLLWNTTPTFSSSWLARDDFFLLWFATWPRPRISLFSSFSNFYKFCCSMSILVEPMAPMASFRSLDWTRMSFLSPSLTVELNGSLSRGQGNWGTLSRATLYVTETFVSDDCYSLTILIGS